MSDALGRLSDTLGRLLAGFDPLAGTFTLPLWAAGVVAALLVLAFLLLLSRAGRDAMAGGLARIALIGIGAGATWLILDGTGRQDVAAERRALEARAGVLATRATMPGSPLACLDAMAGDTVEGSCERTLFSTPEAMASAVSYVAAQLTLFADVHEFVRRGNTELEPLLVTLRRAVENDRFGLAAHVLATRDGCTPEECAAAAILQDPRRININLAQRTYDFYVTRHSAVWPQPAPGPTAGATPTPAPSAASPALPSAASALAGPRPGGPELFFPSASSIPPVNIMTAEPEAETTGSTPARTPPRRPAQAPKQPPMDLKAARPAPTTAQ
jgi:hypothetical protein